MCNWGEGDGCVRRKGEGDGCVTGNGEEDGCVRGKGGGISVVSSVFELISSCFSFLVDK